MAPCSVFFYLLFFFPPALFLLLAMARDRLAWPATFDMTGEMKGRWASRHECLFVISVLLVLVSIYL